MSASHRAWAEAQAQARVEAERDAAFQFLLDKNTAEPYGTFERVRGWWVLQTVNGGWNLFEDCICRNCTEVRRKGSPLAFPFRQFSDASTAFAKCR